MDINKVFEIAERIGHAVDGQQILSIRKERLEATIEKGMRQGLSAEKIANRVDALSYKDTTYNERDKTLTVRL